MYDPYVFGIMGDIRDAAKSLGKICHLKFAKGMTINDLGVGPEEIKEKNFEGLPQGSISIGF